MHPNKAFHIASEKENLAFARDRGFGVLAVCDEGGPLLSHVPFIIPDSGELVELHLVRSNPIARALIAPRPAKIAVVGPDSYISPDWYDAADQVPTWNYVAVHLTGTLELRPTNELRHLLDRQAAAFEERLAPKVPWSTDKMTPEVFDKMMRAIVPCRMHITAVDGTWKLNQNKPDDVRLRAADHVDGYGMGSDPRQLAALMRGAGKA